LAPFFVLVGVMVAPFSLSAAVVSPLAGAFLQDGMHAIPEVRVDDGVMFTGIGLALVQGLTTIHSVVQQSVKVALVDQRLRSG
jgi:hypothetical protein